MSELIGDAEFVASLRDPADLGAYALLVEQLGQRVGDVHPRLSDEAQRYTVGDVEAAELTYAQIVAREATDESPDLPAGAHPYTGDARSRLTMAAGHLGRVQSYLTDHWTWSHPTTLDGRQVVEFQDAYAAPGDYDAQGRWVHPTVEGYQWYRGLRVDTGDDTAVIIMQPWMQAWREGGAPFPALYAIGDPDPAVVQRVVADYYAPRQATQAE